MTKTVKELINFYLSNCGDMSENECLKFEKILILHENEIAEKNIQIIALRDKLQIWKNTKQLYKEDFNVEQYGLPYHSGKIITKITLIDNLKYDNLLSKEDEQWKNKLNCINND